MNKITKITMIVVIGFISFIAILLAARVGALNNQVEFLQMRNNLLVIDYADSQEEIEDLKFELIGANQLLENNYISMESNKLYIQAMESKIIKAEMEYQGALSFIETAEIIMQKIDITYLYTGRR